MRLTLHVGWLALLVSSGVAGGVLAGRAWGDYVSQRRAEGVSDAFSRRSAERRRALERAFGPDDTLARRVDPSLRHGRVPTELRRTQAGAHCAFSFVAFDSTDMQLFNVRAHDARVLHGDGPPVIGQGFAYSERGFRPADTITVVVPYTDCSVSITTSRGYTRISPREPLRLIPR